MEISNNFNRYDSTIQPNQEYQQYQKVGKVGTVKQFLEAFKIDFSQKALQSNEFNDQSINFPTYNTDVLQYSENLTLTYKP